MLNVIEVLKMVGYKEASVKGQKTRLLNGLVADPKNTFMAEEDVVVKMLEKIAGSKSQYKDGAIDVLDSKAFRECTKEFVVVKKPTLKEEVARLKKELAEANALIAEMTIELEALKSDDAKDVDNGFNLAE
jgi:hypothetical protein